MIKRIDKVLAVVAWTAAAVVVLMLLFGPAVVAEDKAKPAAAVTIDPKALFTSKCGGCHTLTKAGTSGQVGPKLDGVNAATVAAALQSGPGVMPSFASLPKAQRDALAAFVSR